MAETGERVLVVEDDREMRGLLLEELREVGYEVIDVGDAETALQTIHEQSVAVVVSDLKLPGGDGMALLERMTGLHERPGFVMITAFGTVEQAMQAVKAGADDFLTKPLDIDHLLVVIARVLEMRRLRRQVVHLERLVDRDQGDFHGMHGASRPMRELFDQIQLVARANGPVLLLGESGTGKEQVARAVHAESAGQQRPFVAVNCAGIPPDLFESEFFGHEAGAFTGATGARKGVFEEASGGTLVLDEIGELPMAMQAKLLRVMDNGRIRPVGANREREVDVRVVAATHRDPVARIAAGEFREDLYYRLESLTLEIPPLRERGEDLDLLAAQFLQRCCAAQGASVQDFSESAVRALHAHDWPGNVRELYNAIQRAVTFCRGDVIDREHLPVRLRDSGSAQAEDDSGELLERLADGPVLPNLDELQRRYLHYVLDQVGGNKRRAAALLGIGRRTLYRWLESEGLTEGTTDARTKSAR